MFKDPQKRFSVLLILIGLIDSIYLTWIKFSSSNAACFGGCDTVNASSYSEIFGVPTALIGAGAYAILLFLEIFEDTNPLINEHFPNIFFALTLIGILFSAYLTYLELEVIHAICPYCVVSAVVMFFLFIISLLRLKREFDMVE